MCLTGKNPKRSERIVAQKETDLGATVMAKTKMIRDVINTNCDELKAVRDYSERIANNTDPDVLKSLHHFRADEVEHWAESVALLTRLDTGFFNALKKAFKEEDSKIDRKR